MSEGIKGKYVISKADGSAVDPEACYFVLRLDRDSVARRAMRSYAHDTPNPTLSFDITECLDELECDTCGSDDPIKCEHETIFYQSRVWRHGGEGEGESGG